MVHPKLHFQNTLKRGSYRYAAACIAPVTILYHVYYTKSFVISGTFSLSQGHKECLMAIYKCKALE